MNGLICQNCGNQNRLSAQFCQHCGKILEDVNHNHLPGEVIESPHPVSPILQLIEKTAESGLQIIRQIDEHLSTFFDVEETATHHGPKESHKNSITVDSSSSAPTVALTQSIPPLPSGSQLSNYQILQAWALHHSNYYRVRARRCLNSHDNPFPLDEHCGICEVELPEFLMREFSNKGISARDFERQYTFVHAGHKGFLPMLDAFLSGNRQYVIAPYPEEPWFSLSQARIPLKNTSMIIDWCVSLGDSLSLLAANQFHLLPDISLPDLMEPIIFTKDDFIGFVDISTFTVGNPLVDESTKVARSHRELISFLGQVLYTLASGNRQRMRRASATLSEVPTPIKHIINQVRHQEYTDLEALIGDLKEIQKSRELTRSLRQIVGYGTDAGRTRDHNEDFVGKYALGMQQTPEEPEVGLYLVADGMGGHQSGELASKDVVREIVTQIQGQIHALQTVPKLSRATIQLENEITPGIVLENAIKRANEVLYKIRTARGSDRGTTITAALIVGDTCAVGNVGDSRTYHLHGETLEQITRDHSLVASLVEADMIEPEEVQSHPQRSHIYRTLGDKPNVEVDIFEYGLQVGDHLLLCSDGLWEMVPDDEIKRTIIKASSPQYACDRLIEKANLAGGEDNIGVIVVRME